MFELQDSLGSKKCRSIVLWKSKLAQVQMRGLELLGDLQIQSSPSSCKRVLESGYILHAGLWQWDTCKKQRQYSTSHSSCLSQSEGDLSQMQLGNFEDGTKFSPVRNTGAKDRKAVEGEWISQIRERKTETASREELKDYLRKSAKTREIGC